MVSFDHDASFIKCIAFGDKAWKSLARRNKAPFLGWFKQYGVAAIRHSWPALIVVELCHLKIVDYEGIIGRVRKLVKC